MQYLKKGTYYGEHKRRLDFENLIITDTEYTHDHVDWHYHQNVYFTYLLKGRLSETNKKESYILSPGTLLFHNWHDAHYNTKYPGYARGFHIEIEKEWFTHYDINSDLFQGSLCLKDPYIKNLINYIYRESKLEDDPSRLTINGLLLQIFGRMMKMKKNEIIKYPQWLKKILEMIRDKNGKDISLISLSDETGVHPVYICTAFKKHFKMTIGEFSRQTKVDYAKKILDNPDLKLNEISYLCGFSDQSHFNRIFKALTGFTPGQYRRNTK